MKLTDQIITTLELPDGKSEAFHWDDAMPGLAVRLRRSGAKVSKGYALQYRVGTQQRRESLGDIRKIKLADARAIARQRFAKIELGSDPAADRAKAKVDALTIRQTVGSLIPRYLATKKPVLRPASYGISDRYLNLHWKPIHAKPISELKRADVAAIVLEIMADRGRIAAARARSALSAFCGWAVEIGLVDHNVVSGSFNPEKNNVVRRDRILSDTELGLVWSAANDDAFGRIVKLLILTGCRRTEIGDLRHDELNLDAGVMVIPAARCKGGQALTLPLPKMALDILRACPENDSKFIFARRGQAGFNAWSYSLVTLNARIAVVTGKPLAHWTLHDLRRSMRTGLGKLGIPPHVAERAIGHAQDTLIQTYDGHDYSHEIGAALAAWADHVAGIIGKGGSSRTNVTSLRRSS